MGNSSDMNDRTKESITKYMKENLVSKEELISLAKVFPAQTTKNLMYSGVLNVITQ